MKFFALFAGLLTAAASALAMPAEADIDALSPPMNGPPAGRRCPDIRRAVPLYRAWNPTVKDHLYTTSPEEIMQATTRLGFKSEGISGYVFRSEERDTVPFYRLYNAKATDHFYTTNVREKNRAMRELGYKEEGIAGWVFDEAKCGSVPFYRLYNSKAQDHFYTVSATERATFEKQGYEYEGVAAFILPTNKM